MGEGMLLPLGRFTGLRDLFILCALIAWLDVRVTPVVAVAQLVESRIVIPAVVGSSPIRHPSISDF